MLRSIHLQSSNQITPLLLRFEFLLGWWDGWWCRTSPEDAIAPGVEPYPLQRFLNFEVTVPFEGNCHSKFHSLVLNFNNVHSCYMLLYRINLTKMDGFGTRNLYLRSGVTPVELKVTGGYANEGSGDTVISDNAMDSIIRTIEEKKLLHYQVEQEGQKTLIIRFKDSREYLVLQLPHSCDSWYAFFVSNNHYTPK